MKYLIIITLCFAIASCTHPDKYAADYELANSTIDSIVAQDSLMQHELNKMTMGSDLRPYLTCVYNRMTFAMIYKKEIEKLPHGSKRNEVVKRYDKEVQVDPDDFRPIDNMDQQQRNLFLKQ
jgi:hypothetical protein